VQGEYSGGFHSEFLGPKRVGASIKSQGAIFPKASTEPPPFVGRASAADEVPWRLAFHKCRGEICVDRILTFHRAPGASR
jgi:hypothetical protein